MIGSHQVNKIIIFSTEYLKILFYLLKKIDPADK